MKPKQARFIVGFCVAIVLSTAGLAGDTLGDSLGSVRFEVSGSPEARQHMIRGVKLLHHMMYPEAEREFVRAAAADPKCALAYWGRAMTIIHPLWPDSPGAADRKLGAEQIRLGLACPPATPRERAYLEVMGAYFGDGTPGNHGDGLKTLDARWSALSDEYPDDLEAVAFGALYHLAPIRFLPKDKSHRVQFEAATQLQKVRASLPDHPGAQHYKIHAYDFPMLADRALEVCDTYSQVAPDVPHALHMPTHIFTRLGVWDKSIEFNLRSAAAARKLWQETGTLNGHYPHALDYLAYAYLQRGQYRQAESIRRLVADVPGPYSPVNPTAMSFAFAAIPARCALERQAWAEAAVLPLHQPASFPWSARDANCDSIVHYARAIGAARSGRLDAARAEAVELERILRALTAARREIYWVAQAETQLLSARAWIAYAEQDTDVAIGLMRRAAELEAGSDKEAVTPGEVLPAGDLLGDMLLAAGRPTEAQAAYEAVLTPSPNRLNTLYGAGQAAERAGNATAALQHYQRLAAVAVDSDAGIERIAHARAYVASATSVHAGQLGGTP